MKFTAMKKIQKPAAEEYPSYAEMYIGLLPDDGLILQHLQTNFVNVKALIATLSPEQLNYAYQPGKWTIKEILTHIIDDERIYSYRALCFARNDHTALPGFDQEDYSDNSETDQRDIANIMQEYEAVRYATIALFNGLSDAALKRYGTANDNKATARALCYHIAGHELHHINFIKAFYL